jgi:MFS family permease
MEPTSAAGVALWGLHMGMTQGLLAALVADEAPINLRATSFGVFNFVSGIAPLLASLIAGALWETVGPYATFMAGAAFTAIGLVGTAVVCGDRPQCWRIASRSRGRAFGFFCLCNGHRCRFLRCKTVPQT